MRLFDKLFTVENPLAGEGHFPDYINPDSLKVLKGCKVEPTLGELAPETRFQLERQGYFCVDQESSDGAIVLNRTVGLRDSWARVQKQDQQIHRK